MEHDLESLVCVHDDRDEDAEDDVDEEADKEVEVDATVPPHPPVDVAHRRERREDVIAVDKTEQTLGRRRHCTELYINTRNVSLMQLQTRIINSHTHSH